jgi:hypothetical protein
MALMAKTLHAFDLALIRQDVKFIQSRHNLPQVGLTHSLKDMTEEEKIVESVGSNYDYDKKTYRFNETDFTEFNSQFKSTYLYEIYKSIPNIGRFRIMNMPGPSAYSIHKDQTRRYHLAVETNSDCLFLFPTIKEMYNIPADGNVYLLDTRITHTFLNGSKGMRTHLVFDDISTLKL